MPCDMSPAPKKADDAPRDSPTNRLPEDNGEGPQAVVINANLDSDSDVSENETAVPNEGPLENDGYQLLSTDPNAPVDNDVNTTAVTSEPNQATVDDQAASRECGELQRQPDPDLLIPHQPRWESVSLDADKVEDIKSRMAGFVLPACQHPTWALEVAEDDWKGHLLDKIRNRTTEEPRQN